MNRVIIVLCSLAVMFVAWCQHRQLAFADSCFYEAAKTVACPNRNPNTPCEKRKGQMACNFNNYIAIYADNFACGATPGQKNNCVPLTDEFGVVQTGACCDTYLCTYDQQTDTCATGAWQSSCPEFALNTTVDCN